MLTFQNDDRPWKVVAGGETLAIRGDRKKTAIRNCRYLGPFAVACWTNCTALFFARGSGAQNP
jgi:hypothetical protein